MKISISRCSWLLACAAGCVSAGSSAAPYPERTVKVIVPFATGGGTDIMGRVLSEKLTTSLGKSFVVENRPGGGAMIGADLVAKSPPDGYTLLLGTSAELTISPALYGREPYNPATDFWPIALLGVSPVLLIANLKFPGNDVRELIALAKARPGQLTFASGGTGTNPHLAGELLRILTGINMVHVPYRGGGPAQTAIIGGEVDLAFTPIAVTLAHLKNRQVKALAVISPKRSPLVPDVPSAGEQGLTNYEAVTWYGLFVPAQTPKDVVDTLRASVAKAFREKEIQARLESLGIEIGSVDQGGEVLVARIKSELATWRRVIKEAGIKAE